MARAIDNGSATTPTTAPAMRPARTSAPVYPFAKTRRSAAAIGTEGRFRFDGEGRVWIVTCRALSSALTRTLLVFGSAPIEMRPDRVEYRPAPNRTGHDEDALRRELLEPLRLRRN